MVLRAQREEREYDKVTQASLNGIYVKAQELDRGHNADSAPHTLPPGMIEDGESHASEHLSDAPLADAETRASGGVDAETDAATHASESVDVETHASTHASDR